MKYLNEMRFQERNYLHAFKLNRMIVSYQFIRKSFFCSKVNANYGISYQIDRIRTDEVEPVA